MISVQNIWVFISVAFLTYFLLSWVYKRLEIVNLENALVVRNGIRLLNLKHSLGIVLFGVLFYMLMPDLRYLITTIEIPRLQILLPFIAVLGLCAWISWTSANRTNHFSESESYHNKSEAWAYFSIRFTFLFCYEFFFRGVLLFALLETFDLAFAIACCTLAYLIIHLFDSKKEIIGTIPFGIVLCLLAYETQTVWYVFILHLTLSAVYEISIFYHQTLKT
ncbi:CPBP family intramembrane glutamic endopeptidase [Hyunsoonleella rubra]|uniref:CPBP family intramembrane glutamic endopeptidase n=1 Tax=Hyunsoonleella rubra TaxID=1737062 RepID=A0ABW5TEC2_9FLAO